jgi:hypothetical protein
MQHGVAAIRGTRTRTSFVLSTAHRLERHLGLHRVFRTPSPRSDVAVAQRQPLHAIRSAARTVTSVHANQSTDRSSMAARSPIVWNAGSGFAAGRRTLSSSTARWRG